MPELTLEERISILDGFFELEKKDTHLGRGNTITDSWREVRKALTDSMLKADKDNEYRESFKRLFLEEGKNRNFRKRR